jgi:Inner membrane protein YgaP-like, transmembrane domain
MSVDRAVLRFAGFMVLLSVALGYYVSPYWYWLTVFVGANLIQSSFTGFCPAAMFFKKLGLKPGLAFR